VIDAKKIETQLGDNPFPEVMKMVPGIYATRTGGGSGDAEINIRGLDQENIALMINGIPVSSVENGLLYWNNWLGLSDITRTVQVQRGLGVSNVALNSVLCLIELWQSKNITLAQQRVARKWLGCYFLRGTYSRPRIR